MALGDGLSRLMGAFRDVAADFTRAERKRDIESPRAGDADAWGHHPSEWPGYPDQRMPPECPVAVLGVQGDVVHCVDALGQIISVPATKRKPEVLFDLFKGHTNFVFHHWPQRNKDGWVFQNVEARQAWNCLVNEGFRQGMFDTTNRVRGRGGWAAGTRRELFVWHAGDAVFTVHQGQLKVLDPGMHGQRFYAAGPTILFPWLEPVPVEECPAADVLAYLSSWRWKRPQLDPLLMLGAIGCAFYSGALEQRPISLIVGDRGVGKSSLIGMEGHGFIKKLLGDVILDAGNASEAGVVQILGQDSRPVALDEFEQKADNNARGAALIEFARQAYSGSIRVRGGSDHKGTSFKLQSPVFMAAVNPPAFENTDYSRMAIFNLQRFEKGAQQPDFTRDVTVTARMMLRRLMDGWGDFNGYLGLWRNSIRLAGLDSRFGDTFGTLLAAAHVLLGDEGMEAAGLPVTGSEEQLGAWVSERTTFERSMISDNWRNCLEHLLAQTIVAWTNGQKPTVGMVLRDVESGALLPDAARERLICAGLGLIDLNDNRAKRLRLKLMADPEFTARHDTPAKQYLLAVPHKGPSLGVLYQGTKWHSGAWTRTLSQAPASVVLCGEAVPEYCRIGRRTERCTLVDLAGYDAEAQAGDEDVMQG